MAAQGAKFVLNLCYTMIMARLLAPAEFGVVAMVMTVAVLVNVFADGLSTVTLQRENITHAQVSNLFWINVVASGVLGLTFAVSAPVLAWFYNEPRVRGVALALSVTFPLTGFTAQHLALMSRQMRFTAKAGIEVASLAAGSIAGVCMAFLKYGYWSLVGAAIVTSASNVALTWSSSRWRPQLLKRGSGTGVLIGFGANLSVGNFIYAIARSSDGLFVGHFFGSSAAGLYSRASVLLMRPLEQFLRPIDAVLEPALSRLQSQPERYRRTFLQVYGAIVLIAFLFTGVSLALARPLIMVALGPKWVGADAIFAGLTLVTLFLPLAKASEWLFTSQGRGRDALKARLSQSVLCVLAFLIGLPHGPAGIAFSFSLSCLVIQLPILNYLAGRSGPVHTMDLWVGFFRHLPVWLVVFTVTRLTRLSLSHSAPIVQVTVCGLAGLLVGVGFIFLFGPTRRTALTIFNALRERRQSYTGATNCETVVLAAR